MRFPYPGVSLSRSITDLCATVCFVSTLRAGSNQGSGNVVYDAVCDLYLPLSHLRLLECPPCSIIDLCCILRRYLAVGGFVVDTVVRPGPGLRPRAIVGTYAVHIVPPALLCPQTGLFGAFAACFTTCLRSAWLLCIEVLTRVEKLQREVRRQWSASYCVVRLWLFPPRGGAPRESSNAW